MHIWSYTITGILILAALSAAFPTSGISAEVKIALRTGPKACIVVSSNDPLMRRTGEWYRDFLATRGYAVEPRIASNPRKDAGPEWILEISNAYPVVGNLSADGYSLTIDDSGRPLIRIVGRNAQGVRSRVVRMVALMKEQDDCLTAPETHERRSPFFSVRRVMICPTGRICDRLLGREWAEVGFPRAAVGDLVRRIDRRAGAISTEGHPSGEIGRQSVRHTCALAWFMHGASYVERPVAATRDSQSRRDRR